MPQRQKNRIRAANPAIYDKYDQAIGDYTKIIEKNQNDAEAYYKRGSAYYDKGLYSRAIADFDKAIEMNPKDADTYFGKADACEKAARYDEAVKAYKIFIEYASPQYTSRINYAKERIKTLEKMY